MTASRMWLAVTLSSQQLSICLSFSLSPFLHRSSRIQFLLGFIIIILPFFLRFSLPLFIRFFPTLVILLFRSFLAPPARRSPVR